MFLVDAHAFNVKNVRTNPTIYGGDNFLDISDNNHKIRDETGTQIAQT